MKRYAIVKGARSPREAASYLPDNYKVIHTIERALPAISVRSDDESRWYVIAGEDKAGWGLDSYVIPRYASGLIGVEEIDLSHPVMKEIPVRA